MVRFALIVSSCKETLFRKISFDVRHMGKETSFAVVVIKGVLEIFARGNPRRKLTRVSSMKLI